MANPWSTGLCSCCEDFENCCMTLFCPCITFGRITEIVDQGATACVTNGWLYALLQYFSCLRWIYSCCYRSKLREHYSLDQKPCFDCIVHCFCEPCALCQEYRQLKNTGFDMTIGWHANVERQARLAAVPPFIQAGMKRGKPNEFDQ